jgi:hypothetical protein
MRRLFAIFIVMFCVVTYAQTPEKSEVKVVSSKPTLTTEQKLAIQNGILQLENAQLRLSNLLQSLQKDGFNLNIQTMEYDVKPPQK